MISQWLLIIGAGIFAALGLAHLAFTFFSDKFHAYDSSVEEAMKQSSPRISKDTTMWQAWVGFNASHSLGPIVFAAFYIPLAVTDYEVVQSSLWLSVLPVIVGLSYLVVAKLYWFKVPFTGILISTLFFIGALFFGFA